MRVLKFFIVICCFLIPSMLCDCLLAQQIDVKGQVTDAFDGSTLPGVTVLIKGTSQGTATDLDGYFSLKVNPDAILQFSFIGYVTQDVVIKDSKFLNISLEPSVTYLDEVVVIGYGEVKKGDATGAVTAIGEEDFNQGAIINPLELVAGKTAGVQVTPNSGAPGSGATIRIRGGSSLSASNDPLYVIDGIPVDNDGIAGTRNPLSMLNPNDIESFTILKDASASAIYGSRASNGVVIITTKKGKATGYGAKLPFSIDYNGSVSLYALPKLHKVLDGDEFRELMLQRYSDDPAIIGMIGSYNTDWQKQIYRNAIGIDQNISVGGKYKSLPYRFSLSYADYEGVLKTDDMQRTTLGLNLNPSLFKDRLKVNISTKGLFTNNNFGNTAAIGAAVMMDPTKPVYDPDNALGGYWAWTQSNGEPVKQATANPMALLYQQKDKSDVGRFIGNMQLNYSMPFLPELSANMDMGLDYSHSHGTVFVPADAAFAYDNLYGGGVNSEYEQRKWNELFNFTVNYSKELKAVDGKLDALAGYSWQHFQRSGNNFKTNDLTSPLLVERRVLDSTDYNTENYIVSFFGRVNYVMKDRYLLTVTARGDGSSRFAPDNRWGFFPSTALAWRIDKEKWMQKYDNITELKLRLGWGITGQQNITDDDYPYLANYTYSQQNALYQIGNQYIVTLRPDGYDANIKWEETYTYNMGFDYGFFNQRLYGSLDVYLRHTKDLINFIPVPAGSNLTNYVLTNVGDLENKGFEFSIVGIPLSNKDMYWEIGTNFTYNVNKITKLTASDNPDYLGVLVGGISGGTGNTVEIHAVGYPSFTFFVYEQVYDENGKPVEGLYVDRNGDGVINAGDLYYYKDAVPDFYFGISSRFSYKNWDFSFGGRACFGNYVYNNFSSNNAVYSRLYRSEGPYLSNIAENTDVAGFYSPQYLSDYYVQRADFFKLDYITIGYDFTDLLKNKFKLKATFTVNNVFTITPYKGIDPEVFGGIDNNIYPSTRAFVFGVNLGL